MKVIVNAHLPRFKLVQFRFPKTKKARIKKKWAKNNRNYRQVPCKGAYIIGGHTLVIHPDDYAILKRQAEKEKRERAASFQNVAWGFPIRSPMSVLGTCCS